MGNPLRILHVVVNMNRGGAETLLMNLYRNIDRTKVQFDFLTCKEGVFDKEIKDMGGRVHQIPYISDVGHFGYIKELNKFFSSNNGYKIVHSHLDKMSGIVLREAKKAGILIRISHSHNTQSEGGLAAKLYKWYTGKLILPNATNYFACSRDAAQWLFPKNFNNTMVLKNGIEYQQFAFSPNTRKQVRDELNIQDDYFVLGHVGRFCLQKNHTYLLDIFAEFHQNNEKSILVLAGEGPLRNKIEQKARKLGLADKILFLGVRSDIHRLLQAFDLFIFPSLHEGLPVSLVEAQGSGLPCIISSEVSREVDLGLNLIEYAPLDNTTAWVEKIKMIAEKRNNRIIKSYSLIEKGYDIKKSAYQLEEFYLKAEGTKI